MAATSVMAMIYGGVWIYAKTDSPKVVALCGGTLVVLLAALATYVNRRTDGRRPGA